MVAAQNETWSAAAKIKEQWIKGAVGYVPEIKDDRVCRFVFENYNSLSFWHSQHKIHHLNKLLRQPTVQWDMADTNLRLDKLLMPGQQNKHEAFSRSQHGGVSLATFDRLSQFIMESGADPTGLGRWVWMKISSGSLVTIVVVAYLPCKSKAAATSVKQRRETVYKPTGQILPQHWRCTVPEGHLCGSSYRTATCTTEATGNVYDVILAVQLQREEIRMVDVCEAALGHKSPNSHASGTLPITGVFVTSDLVAQHVFQSSHGFGLEDHRVFVVDIDLAQLLDSEYSQLVRLPGRKLQAKRYHVRKAYNKSLRDNIRRHKLTEKYHQLYQSHQSMSPQEISQRINQLDREKTELMKCAESKCKRKCAGKLPNSPKAKELASMLEQEALHGGYQEIKKTTSKGKGRKVISIELEGPDGTRSTISSKLDIERVAGQTIGERYRLAYSAPIMSHNKLLCDVGFSGDGPAVESILRGTYCYPDDTDPYTQLFVLEATVLFSSLGEQGIEDWVHSHDFQQFWLHACERTESSKSQLHFGHYMAGAHDPGITELHVASLNTNRETGVAPDRWRNLVTVLLEKVFGVRLITKLRVICQLEADFNWLDKLIFAHIRLEVHCCLHGLTPPEQFAKSKSCCKEASLIKNLTTDGGRILHNSSDITSNDFNQCYDRGCAPISGLAARAHCVSRQSTRLMLQTMQRMVYFIKTGFRISELRAASIWWQF
eukprot:scaffold15968_cov46-Cyclotella_meneghiniana.AAC.14